MSKRTPESFSKPVLVRCIRKHIGLSIKIEELEYIEKQLKMDAAKATMDDAIKKMKSYPVASSAYWKHNERFDRARKKLEKLMGLKS
jgi:hypothetical protein